MLPCDSWHCLNEACCLPEQFLVIQHGGKANNSDPYFGYAPLQDVSSRPENCSYVVFFCLFVFLSSIVSLKLGISL